MESGFAQTPGVFSPPVYKQSFGTFQFENDVEGWEPEIRARLIHTEGILEIQSSEGNPGFYRLFDARCDQLRLRMRIRTRVESECEIYWLTREIPQRDSTRMVKVRLAADDHWNDYEIHLPINGQLSCISMKMIGPAGSWFLDSVDLYATISHPLSVIHAGRESNGIRFTVFNSTLNSVDFLEEGSSGIHTLSPRSSVGIFIPLEEKDNLARAELRLKVEGFPTTNYPVFLYLPERKTEWLVRNLTATAESSLDLEISKDARIARIVRKNSVENPGESPLMEEDTDTGNENTENVLAIFAPLVHKDGKIPDFQLVSDLQDPDSLSFSSPDANLDIFFRGNELRFFIGESNVPALEKTEPKNSESSLKTDREEDFSSVVSGELQGQTPPLFNGPTVRVLGDLRGGLLCGVEYIGIGDTTSSKIDIKEPNHLRSDPSPQWITNPLAVFASDQLAVGLLWEDMRLRPEFSSPNSGNLSTDHCMSLKGEKIEAVVRIVDLSGPSEGPLFTDSEKEGENANSPYLDPITDMILWMLEKRGIPEPPDLPRNAEQQNAICLSALEGPLLGIDRTSWGYYAESDTPRKPFADILSTLYWLRGELPDFSGIVPEGSVLTDDSIYFLTNRTHQWKDLRGEDVRITLEEQQLDGSFFRRSLFPDLEPRVHTSLGYSARKAAFLLDYARITGNKQVLNAAERTLQFLQEHDVPRGGFYWETPLHTPDILSSAYACWSFSRGYELTGKPKYLQQARRFALSGLAFVYLWSDEKPIQLYTSVPMFGATHRENPWFATAQPWSGIVFAYALNLLSEHDSSVDWKKIATGMLIAAEQMQYPEGPYTGCVPDAFSIESQQRYSLKLNPCGLVSLRRAIEGKVENLSVISDSADTVASPFRIQKNRRGAIIRDVPPGFRFEILINGQRIQQVQGSGNRRDQIMY